MAGGGFLILAAVRGVISAFSTVLGVVLVSEWLSEAGSRGGLGVKRVVPVVVVVLRTAFSKLSCRLKRNRVIS